MKDSGFHKEGLCKTRGYTGLCSEGISFAPLEGAAGAGLCVFDTFSNPSKAVLNMNRFKNKRCLDNTSFQKAFHRGEVFPVALPNIGPNHFAWGRAGPSFPFTLHKGVVLLLT